MVFTYCAVLVFSEQYGRPIDWKCFVDRKVLTACLRVPEAMTLSLLVLTWVILVAVMHD